MVPSSYTISIPEKGQATSSLRCISHSHLRLARGCSRAGKAKKAGKKTTHTHKSNMPKEESAHSTVPRGLC